MQAAGTVAVADVSNSLATVGPLRESGLHALVLHEILGFDPAKASYVLEQTKAARAALPPEPEPVRPHRRRGPRSPFHLPGTLRPPHERWGSEVDPRGRVALGGRLPPRWLGRVARVSGSTRRSGRVRRAQRHAGPVPRGFGRPQTRPPRCPLRPRRRDRREAPGRAGSGRGAVSSQQRVPRQRRAAAGIAAGPWGPAGPGDRFPRELRVARCARGRASAGAQVPPRSEGRDPSCPYARRRPRARLREPRGDTSGRSGAIRRDPFEGVPPADPLAFVLHEAAPARGVA